MQQIKRTKRGGRIKGVPNRITASVRLKFNEAFHILQEDRAVNLVEWGRSNPTEFYRLASKLIPLQITNEEPGGVQTIIQIIPDPLSAPITD
jgi:hypothetical protein